MRRNHIYILYGITCHVYNTVITHITRSEWPAQEQQLRAHKQNTQTTRTYANNGVKNLSRRFTRLREEALLALHCHAIQLSYICRLANAPVSQSGRQSTAQRRRRRPRVKGLYIEHHHIRMHATYRWGEWLLSRIANRFVHPAEMRRVARELPLRVA